MTRSLIGAKRGGMRSQAYVPFPVPVLLALALLLSGCPGIDGGKAQARAALERPTLTPKNLFSTTLPKRKIGSLLVVGDSLSIGLASELEKTLADQPGLRVSKLGKVSSGLARPEFFDWDQHMEQLARQHRPDAVVVMLGTNDNKHLRRPDGSQIIWGTPEWSRAYTERVKHLVEICRKYSPQATVFWLGAPVMADAALSRDLRHINALLRRAMGTMRDAHYVDTWKQFSAPGGGYVAAKPELEGGAPLRARDGIHMTPAGAQALAGVCLEALSKRIELQLPAATADKLRGGLDRPAQTRT